MLDFLANYPLGYYLKTANNPRAKAKRVGLYFSRDHTMLLLKQGSSIVYWSNTLKEVNGAPTIEATEEKSLEGSHLLPSTYRQEVFEQYKLGETNEVTVVVDDPETYTAPYTVNNYTNAAELQDALSKDPGSVITAWKTYHGSNDYIWEILSSGIYTLREKNELPKKTILTGFPEKRAAYLAKWCDSQNQELVNLYPIIPAVLKWAVDKGPTEGFFLLINCATEIAIAYVDKREVRIFSSQKTTEGFTADEISDVNELAEDLNLGRDAVIWTWGIMPGSTAHSRLVTRYANLKTLSVDELQKIEPLELTGPGSEPNGQSKELWILNYLMD
jgi:predicted transcriptional regulator